MKIDKTNVKTPLTKSELDLLIRKQMPNDRLDRIRDVFVFCCLAGLAFTDADHLRREHLSTDEQGTQWIHKPREKTAVMSRITVSDQAARQVCERSGASGQRQTIARAEQPEDEQSPQRNRRNL